MAIDNEELKAMNSSLSKMADLLEELVGLVRSKVQYDINPRKSVRDRVRKDLK